MSATNSALTESMDASSRTVVLPLMRSFAPHGFLGSRSTARNVRVLAEAALTGNPTSVVVLDFDGVEGVSHGFTDELLSPLHELLGDDVRHRVVFLNGSEDTVANVRSVVDLHELVMPLVSA